MRLTLFKYISREIWTIFFVSQFVFIFIIMATQIMGITDLLVNQRAQPVQILIIILCMLPNVIINSMPAACLMSILLAFMRLSSDNEIIALNSSGIGNHQLMPPVLFFSLASLLIAGFITIFGVPWGNSSYRNVLFQIAKSNAGMTIKERIFYEPFNNVVFYVNSYSSKEKTMSNLFIVDKRDSSSTKTIVAKEGMILSNNYSNVITVLLRDGTIFTSGTSKTTKFDAYPMSIDLGDIMSRIISRKKEPKEMYIGELLDHLKNEQDKKLNTTLTRITLLEMFSIPVAIFLMGFIGAPLGVKTKGRNLGIPLGLLIFLIYYSCLTIARYMSEMDSIHPYIGVWFPDIILLFICLYIIPKPANFRWSIFLKLGPCHRRSNRPLSVSGNRGPDVQETDSFHFFGNHKSNKFHRPDCRWMKKISPKNRVAFKSIDEALGGKYTPCNTCKPS